MPKPFDSCVERGGKIRTQQLSKNRYRRTCTIGGKTYLGHIKKKKKESRTRK